MHSIPTFAFILAVAVVYLNVAATYHVLKVDTLAPAQRAAQVVLVWLIPLFGSIFISSFHLSDKDYVRHRARAQGLSARLVNVLTFVYLFHATHGGLWGAGAGDDGDGGPGPGGFGGGDGGGLGGGLGGGDS